jgi:biotin-dependent carboxylase-like uncharacterized protein
MVRVLKAGFYTSIQDKGRTGFASIGVPVSGAMDSYAADLANHILNNSLEDAVLEITFGGCVLEFLTATYISISGGNFSAKINNNPILLNTRIKIHKKDVLSFGNIKFGVRCYVAVKNGFLTEKVLKSRSFYKGITSSFLIKKNDLLPIATCATDLEQSTTSIKILKAHFTSQELKCDKGPEFNLLNDLQKEQLKKHVFTISNLNNRMGYQLKEPIKNRLPQLLTSAVLPGTVQLTPSGKLIVLMRDCQVTGGYPRILQLSRKAINGLAQKSTGDTLQFTFN